MKNRYRTPLDAHILTDARFAPSPLCRGQRHAGAAFQQGRSVEAPPRKPVSHLSVGMLLLALLLLALCGATALAEEAGESADEWTVMLYLCGSDLESDHSYASGNLEEILKVDYPDNLLADVAKMYGADIGEIEEPGRVNILIETGGAMEWHAQNAGMEIDADALQRWRYDYYPHGGLGSDGPFDGYSLVETLPLKSMADPETLTDFIQWGVQTNPAKKYALVLWDHGGGARTGLFIDELFDNDVMYLYELRKALADSGAYFEAVVIDACLMANLETAWSIENSAHWMVASEENVPGKGTAIGEWMSQLIDNPTCDGKWLGRTICDETLVKYVNDEDEQGRSILTWSVIDLSKIDPLIEVCGRFFEAMNDALRHYPMVANLYARNIFEAEEYGSGQEDMRDLISVAFNRTFVHNMDAKLRSEVLNALSEAVVYSIRGPGRAGARGLSFCYPTDFSAEEMEIYAKNFPMPAYLAYLDAICDWEAPDWVYDHIEHVPDIDSIEEFRLKAVKRISGNGWPGLDMTESITNIDNVYYRLYRLDSETGEAVRLGRTDCSIETSDEGGVLYRATDPLNWPSVEGQLICIDLIQSRFDQKLYNVPVQIDSENCMLRCGRVITYSEDGAKRLSKYTVYGLWEGFEEYSELFSRSVKPLPMLSGQEYRFLYPLDGQGYEGNVNYRFSQPLTMYRALSVKEIPLPVGTYYLEYEVDDMFERPYLLDRIEFYWDGESITFPEGFSWEGEIVLNDEAGE